MKKLLSYGVLIAIFTTIQMPWSYAENQGKKESISGKILSRSFFIVSDSDHWQSAVSNLNNLAAQYPDAKLRVDR